MKTTNPTYRLSALGLVVAVACLLAPGTAPALNPTIRKLYEPGSAPGPTGFGTCVALSSDHILIGEPRDLFNGIILGAVHQFDARTGRYLRKLQPDVVSKTGFGGAIAISGNLIAASAPSESGAALLSGAVYIFDARTGRRLHKLRASDEGADDGFGSSVSLCGELLLVGAPGDEDSRGAAYLFNARTGEELGKMTAPDGQPSDDFGSDVALQGDLALIGAPGDDAYQGSAYLLQASTGAELFKFTAWDGAGGDQFGRSVALDGGWAVVGAPLRDLGAMGQGAVYLFDLITGSIENSIPATGALTEGAFGTDVAMDAGLLAISNGIAVGIYQVRTGDQLDAFKPLETIPEYHFGASIALSANRLVAGVRGDNDFSSGSAYVFSSVTGPTPLMSVTKVGDAAPGGLDINFRSFSAAYMSVDTNVVFSAGLTGIGSNRGRDTGIWATNQSDTSRFTLSARSRDPIRVPVTPFTLLAPRAPLANQSIATLYEASIAGTGVNRTNNHIIVADYGGSTRGIIRTGDPVALLGGAAIGRILEVVQPDGATPHFSVAFNLQRGVGGTTTADDSGVLVTDVTGPPIRSFREGSPIPGGGGAEFRQFFGRVSHGGADDVVFPAYVVDGGLPEQRLFRENATAIASGTILPGEGLATAGRFLAEAASQPFGPAVSRFTLTGPDVTRRNNEIIWSQAFGKVARKGDPVAGEPAGVVFAGFLGFWPVDADRVIFLAKLAGPGVGRANDCGLYLWQEDQSHLELLREGDLTCQDDGARIGTLARVDVNPVSGDYTVLATLTGNRARNLALFIGDADEGSATTRKALRQPLLMLRKGTLYHSTAAVTGIRSMNLSPVTDRGGAGGKGRSQVISAVGRIAVTIDFDNRVRELMTGKPDFPEFSPN